MDSFYGIMLFALAGFVSAAFYTPLKYVKWKWEVMWIFWSLAALIICPTLIASFAIPSCWQAIGEVEFDTIIWTFVYGALWGVGGLTFGLSMRYLGIGLGTAVALGFCALVGTLIPPIKSGKILEIASDRAGLLVLIGVFICALGIAINGVAGMMKERDAKAAGADGGSSEFSLAKGFAVAIVAGFLSACMSLSMDAGKPIAGKGEGPCRDRPRAGGAFQKQRNPHKSRSSAALATNFAWCLFLSFKNKSFADAKAAGRGQGDCLHASVRSGRSALVLPVLPLRHGADETFGAVRVCKLGYFDGVCNRVRGRNRAAYRRMERLVQAHKGGALARHSGSCCVHVRDVDITKLTY